MREHLSGLLDPEYIRTKATCIESLTDWSEEAVDRMMKCQLTCKKKKKNIDAHFRIMQVLILPQALQNFQRPPIPTPLHPH